MKIIVFILTALIQLTLGAFAFFMLLLGLNGYHESDATPSLIMYILLVLASAAGLGLASVYAAKRLSQTSLGAFGAAAIAVIIFAVVGGIVIIVGLLAAVFLAEIVRTWK